MNHFLKHMSIRIWVTALLGSIAGLWILKTLQYSLEANSPVFPVLLIMVIVFISSGWLFNRIGLRMIKNFILQAGVWERGGQLNEAEQSFVKALSVFDSFLISPLTRKKRFRGLSSRMARFFLARPDQDKFSQTFIISYLRDYPDDRAVAESWLQQASGNAGKKAYQEIAYRIGNAHPEDPAMQRLLLRFYLAGERTDFFALQTYRRILEHDRNAVVEFAGDIASLFLRQGRADEWALRVYLQVLELREDRPEMIKGVAACYQFLPRTEQNAPLFERAAAYLADLDEPLIERLSTGFKCPLQESPEIRPGRIKNVVTMSGVFTAKTAATIFRLIRSSFKQVFDFFIYLLRWIKGSEKARKTVKWILLSGLAAGVMALLVNTVNYLVPGSPDTLQDQARHEIEAPRRFTIQVAAYLKQEHAEQYTELLRKKGLDAYYTTASGTKKKWYQVRVAHFATKVSAKAYGEQLKMEGKIKDFYVANYDGVDNPIK